MQQSLGTVDAVLTTRLQTIQTQNERVDKTADRLSLGDAYQSLYYDAWDSINDAIIKPALNATIIQEPDGTPRGIGELVGDFRGLLVSRGQGESFIALPQQSDKTKTEPPVLRDVLHGNPFDADQDINMVDTIMPFMLADPHLANADDGVTGKPPFESLEHTFSMLHRRRAIYASALGINKRKPHLKKLPLTYFVLSTHQERWQLGRLIESLHIAGTTRIAAMMGLGEVERANEDLRKVEVKLSKIAEDMPLAFNEAHQDSNGGSITARLIQATADLAAASGKVTNGLSRRAERSRYYISQFENASTNLAVSRIEGFQPYNRFVDHLFGSAHRFIRMTGTRFERLETRIREMDEQVQTAESVKSEKESAKYLKVAEYFAFLVLLPYYFPGYVSKILSLKWPKIFKADEDGYKWLTAGALIIGAVLSERERLIKYTITCTQKVSDFKKSTFEIIRKQNAKVANKVYRVKYRITLKSLNKKRKAMRLATKWYGATRNSWSHYSKRVRSLPKRAVNYTSRLIKRKKPPDPN